MQNEDMAKTVLATVNTFDYTKNPKLFESTLSPPLPTEQIVPPNRADYLVPSHLTKTAPHLVSRLESMMESLFELNQRCAGALYYELDAYFGIVGLHEELELDFYYWCNEYFNIRGNPSRLNHQNRSCPWILFGKCMEEYGNLFERLIIMPGTVNAIVLNLSQVYFHSEFATRLFEPDLLKESLLPNRFLNTAHREYAYQRIAPYVEQQSAIPDFLAAIEAYMPDTYHQSDDLIASKVLTALSDMAVFRHLFPLGIDNSSVFLADHIWGKLEYTVAPGGMVLRVRTSDSDTIPTDSSTMHAVGYRRDGHLCNFFFPWLTQNSYGKNGLAVAHYLLDSLSAKFYEKWDSCDPNAIREEGASPVATEAQQVAALKLAYFDHTQTADSQSRPKRFNLPGLHLSRIQRTLADFFNCKVESGKGSEIKIFRPGVPGAKIYSFGRHKADPTITGYQLNDCLKRLRITPEEFLAVSK